MGSGQAEVSRNSRVCLYLVDILSVFYQDLRTENLEKTPE
jgi:hypothetical protein